MLALMWPEEPREGKEAVSPPPSLDDAKLPSRKARIKRKVRRQERKGVTPGGPSKEGGDEPVSPPRLPDDSETSVARSPDAPGCHDFSAVG